MTHPGIDYANGQANIDRETGIHYGVISQHSVGQAWYDEAEADYGKAHCPKCDNEACEYDDDKHGKFDQAHGCTDYACESCELSFDSQDCFPDEAIGWNYDGDGYVLTDCLDNDIFVLKSPFYTFAQFCSPCVPGAGNLNNPCENGAKSYCLGHDWFEDSKAPYPVYRVDTGALVEPTP